MKKHSSILRFVTFRTEGSPHDKGFDLIDSERVMIENIKKENCFESITVHTPRTLKENGFGHFVKEFPSSGSANRNPNCQNIGFLAWKPLIILQELEKCKEGDIVVYRDCNCHKYECLKDFSNMAESVDNIFEIVGFDFVISQEAFDRGVLTVGEYCKSDTIRELAKNIDFTRSFPLLIANHIVVRKSAQSLQLLYEWLTCCQIDRLIDGSIDSEEECFPEFKFSTSEQAILNVIITNWIVDGKLDEQYPNVVFLGRNMSNYRRIV
jgi:hypothetical protein